jgi:hypothetical protein
MFLRYSTRGVGSVAMFALASASAVAEDLCTAGPAAIAMQKSMVVTDQALLSDVTQPGSKFGFQRTINRVLETMPFGPMEKTAETREFFVQTMLNSLLATERVNLASGLRMRLSSRPGEANLKPRDLLDPTHEHGLVPTGVFNRFDLVPSDLNNCGEYRIVYSFKKPIAPPKVGSLPDRFFLIFEARLDNPTTPDAAGEMPAASCRPIAEFWRGLTDKSNAELGSALEDFFFKDSTVGQFKSAIRAEHFGFPLGQVRGNLFLEDIWQLREWRVGVADSGAGPQFIPITIKDNPLVELYQDNNPDALDLLREDVERAAFQKGFTDGGVPEAMTSYLSRLFDADGDAVPGLDTLKGFPSPETQIIGALGARFHDRFNEFQGVSQGHSDNPSVRAEGGIRTDTEQGLAALNPRPDADVAHVLNRAGALTCGGCHQFSNNQLIRREGANALLWPPSGGFVHIQEPEALPNRPPPPRLSPALTERFLPFRRWILWKELCEKAPPPGPVAMGAPQATGARAGETAQLRPSMQRELETQASPSAAAPANTLGARRSAPPSQGPYATPSGRVGETGWHRTQERQKPGAYVTNRRSH